MLSPKENKVEGKLELVCRNCEWRCVASNYRIFQHQIKEREAEKAIAFSEVPNDPTLPRTYDIECEECKFHEAVFLKVRTKDSVKLYFVCAGCGHHWS